MANLYREVLDSVPSAAIVVDKNMKVRYANRAFGEYFRAKKLKGTLRDITDCGEREGACGEGVRCAYCPLKNLFEEVANSGKTAFRKIIMRSGDEGLALRMEVRPLGKFLLGIVDNAYETEIAREMHSAQSIQQRLLPPSTGLGGPPYSFTYIPCREIGGDLPDVYMVGGNTVALLADVSGKGVAAGMLSAFVKAGWDRSEPSPSRALSGLNRKFAELNLDERSYITAVAVRIDEERREICYSFAGHNAPMLLRRADGIAEIEGSTPPISTWIPDFRYEDRTLGYEKGDILVLLTDGVIESKSPAGEQFGVERVEALLARSENAERFIERLKAALKSFCGVFEDDITAIAFDL